MSIFSINHFVKLNEKKEELVEENNVADIPNINIMEVSRFYKEVINLDENRHVKNDNFYYEYLRESLNDLYEDLKKHKKFLNKIDEVHDLEDEVDYIDRQIDSQKNFLREEDLNNLIEKKNMLLERLADSKDSINWSYDFYKVSVDTVDESKSLSNEKEYIPVSKIVENLDNLLFFVSNKNAKHVNIVKNMAIASLDEIKKEFVDFL